MVACDRLRPDLTQLADPVQAANAALRASSAHLALEQEIKLVDQRLGELVPKAAPRTSRLLAIGIEHAGQLLVTAGDNLGGSVVRRRLLHLAVWVRIRYCPHTHAYVERRAKEGLSGRRSCGA